jgi:hypothetical protein
VAEAIAAHEVAVVEPTFEIVVTPASSSTPLSGPPLSTLNHDVRIVKNLRSAANAVSATTRRRFPLRFRADDANAALLHVRRWSGPAVKTPAKPILGWQPAAIVVPRWRNGHVEPMLWHTSVQFESGRYRLRDPIDAAAFGSPVWTEAGVAGLLQDELSAADVATVMRRLN